MSKIGNPHLDEQYSLRHKPLNQDEFIDYKVQVNIQKKWLNTPINELPEFIKPLPNKLVVARPPVDAYKDDPSGKGIFVGDVVMEERLSEIPVYLRVEAIGENEKGIKKGDYVIFSGNMDEQAAFVYKGVKFAIFELFQVAAIFKPSELSNISLNYDPDAVRNEDFYMEVEESVKNKMKEDLEKKLND